MYQQMRFEDFSFKFQIAESGKFVNRNARAHVKEVVSKVFESYAEDMQPSNYIPEDPSEDNDKPFSWFIYLQKQWLPEFYWNITEYACWNKNFQETYSIDPNLYSRNVPAITSEMFKKDGIHTLTVTVYI